MGDGFLACRFLGLDSPSVSVVSLNSNGSSSRFLPLDFVREEAGLVASGKVFCCFETFAGPFLLADGAVVVAFDWRCGRGFGTGEFTGDLVVTAG